MSCSAPALEAGVGGEDPAGVACAHRAWLGDVEAPGCGCSSAPQERGPWLVAVAPSPEPVLDVVVADLERGISPAGALLRAADRFGPDQGPLTVVVAGSGQVAALVWRTPLRYAVRGGGAYLVDATEPATHPDRDPAPNQWQAVPPGSVLLLDPCGPTVTRIEGPELG